MYLLIDCFISRNSVYENANDSSSGASPTPQSHAYSSHHAHPAPASPARQPPADTKKVHFNLATIHTHAHCGHAEDRSHVCEARNEEVGVTPRARHPLTLNPTPWPGYPSFPCPRPLLPLLAPHPPPSCMALSTPCIAAALSAYPPFPPEQPGVGCR